jgi:SAM-dependent methyltransferase
MESILSTFQSWLPAKPTRILDVGAGMGGIDVKLYSYYRNPELELWLLDRSGVSDKHVAGYKMSPDDFAFYNSFDRATELLRANGVPDNNIITLDVGTQGFPVATKFTAIISLLAWGFHFPVSSYLESAYQSLTLGGCMILDVRKGTDGLWTLEERFGAPPTVVKDEEKFQRVVVRRVSR